MLELHEHFKLHIALFGEYENPVRHAVRKYDSAVFLRHAIDDDIAVDNIIIVAGSQALKQGFFRDIVIHGPEIGCLVAIVIGNIGDEQALLQHVAGSGQIVHEGPRFRPPHHLRIHIHACVIGPAGIAGLLRRMGKTVIGNPVEALAKCPVHYPFPNEGAVLPTPPGGPCFRVDIGLAIGVCRRGYFFDQENVVPISYPEFTARYAHVPQRFERINRTGIPNGRAGPAGLSGKFEAVFGAHLATRRVVTEYQKIADRFREVIFEPITGEFIFDGPPRHDGQPGNGIITMVFLEPVWKLRCPLNTLV